MLNEAINGMVSRGGNNRDNIIVFDKKDVAECSLGDLLTYPVRQYGSSTGSCPLLWLSLGLREHISRCGHTARCLVQVRYGAPCDICFSGFRNVFIFTGWAC